MASWVWALATVQKAGLSMRGDCAPVQPELTAALAQTRRPETHVGSREGETPAWPPPTAQPSLQTRCHHSAPDSASGNTLAIKSKGPESCPREGNGYTTSLRGSQGNHMGPP